tara:strand:- start:3906 stop:4355 length:450 start_codon:yes stop_codon:yes gene_type:complete
MGGGKTAISYLSATLATHTQFQKVFSEMIENNINPTDVVFSLGRTKIKTATGRNVNGYSIEETDEKVFVKEKFRPSLLNSDEQEVRWIVPEEIVNFLQDKDGDPMSLIDLFLLLRDKFSGIQEKEMKKYAVKLINNNVLDLRKAKERWI